MFRSCVLLAIVLKACWSGQPNDLRIDVRPAALSLTPGTAARLSVAVTRQGALRQRPVTIVVAGLPPGVTADPLAIPGAAANGTLTLRVAGDAPLIDSAVAAIHAFAGGYSVVASAPLSINVVAPFDFDGVPALVSLPRGGSAKVPLSVTWRSGATGDVLVHVARLPGGVSAADALVPAGAAGGSLLFSASPEAATGTASIDVTASSGGFTTVRSVDLSVTLPVTTRPVIRAFVPASGAIFVGERTQLAADFDGQGSIDGIGPVASGVPVDTPPLSRDTTFTLRVRLGGEEAQARTLVRASYRDRLRVLHVAPFGQTNHVAAALPGARAIVMGGNTTESPLLPDSTLSQLFDPATETFSRGPELPLSAQAQFFTSIAPLANGGFLLVGTGLNGGVARFKPVATQVFDPAAQSFTRVGNAATFDVDDRTATPLADSGVLLTGGMGGDAFPVDSVDRYDAATGQWRAAGPLLQVRETHTATLLRDGRVLIAGGLSCCRTGPVPQFYAATAEVYDPASGSFTATGSMTFARGGHAAVLLADGRVLIAGGDSDDGAPLDVEIWDPATGQFSSGGALRAARDGHAALRLTDGRVLVIGGEVPPLLAGRVGVGASTTEIFDPATGSWSSGPTLDPAFYTATVTQLDNGKVLLFGGQDLGGSPQSAAALFE